MKKFINCSYIFSVLFLSCIFLTGCTNNNFQHTMVNFNPESNGGKFQFEVNVLDVSNDYSSNIWSRGLDATIQIKTTTKEEVVTGYLLELYDFEFYITKPYTVYKTYMYLENPQNEITQIILEPQTTIQLHLRIDYDSSIFKEDNEVNNYVIKLWNKRI